MGHYRGGGTIVGVCGGYQMLGEYIEDPYHIETTLGKLNGMGLLPVRTVIEKEKMTSQVRAKVHASDPFFMGGHVMIARGKEEDVLEKRIVAAREAVGFSITQAAQKLGFKNYQTLSAIEKGTRKINAHELIMMARLYGRSLDYFLESDVTPDPDPLWRKTTKTDINQVQRQ